MVLEVIKSHVKNHGVGYAKKPLMRLAVAHARNTGICSQPWEAWLVRDVGQTFDEQCKEDMHWPKPG